MNLRSFQRLRWLHTLLLFAILAGALVPQPVQAADSRQFPNQQSALEILADMTPAEKVGQLMLITFPGVNAGAESQIVKLITEYHVGGIVISAANQNITGPEDTPRQVWELIQALQTAEWQYSQPLSTLAAPSADPPVYVPLFVGVSQEGDGYPYSQILSGLTPLPNQMALGATWDTSLAKSVGQVLGKELATLGFNLLLGPSLDVLEDPNPDGAGDLGTRTFSGDPFWVAEFGQAFITGVHEGSQNHLAVVGKYFPGRGSSDRPPEEEVATIRKTLEQLKQIELAPFFAVTGDAPTDLARVDALLTSHIKYQGFQTNIRATTRPISFDPQAFNQLMSLPALSTWRQNGGLMISDELGSLAVRRFYDPSMANFNARFVARDALLAGNDLLYLGNFVGTDDPDLFTSIIRTLEFFAQKYREDAVFASRVDDAVLRILNLKLKLYPQMELESVLQPETGLAEINQSQGLVFQIARQAATLISPSAEELDTILPEAPLASDRIVFITDDYKYQQCAVCPEQSTIDVNALQDAVLRLYGPDTTGQTARRNLLSYSFDHIITMLERGVNRTDVEFFVRNAQWVVFAVQDVDPARPASTALRRFLSERPDLLRGKQVIVFSFNAPYYLDGTDITKLTAYYALYSKSPQFIEVAARLLFGELRPITGSLPVTVEGINYILFEVTSPDPLQTIPLLLDLPVAPTPTGDATATPSPEPEFQVGDVIAVRSGVILDHNGRPVADNTPVTFSLSITSDLTTVTRDVIATTLDGVARATFLVEALGNLEIRARADQAVTSDIIRMTIAGQRPTPTPSPSPSPSPTTEPTITPTSTPPPVVEVLPEEPASNLPALLAWLISVLVSTAAGWIAFRSAIILGQVRWSMRLGLLGMIGGLLAYGYYTLELPGSAWLFELSGPFGGILFSLGGALLGVLLAWAWRQQTRLSNGSPAPSSPPPPSATD